MMKSDLVVLIIEISGSNELINFQADGLRDAMDIFQER